MTNPDNGNTPTELADDDRGVWLVETTSGSIYRFDLDANTVERVGGEPRRPTAPADSLQSLRSLIEVRVGRPGRWWMRNTTGGFTNPSELWQWSSVIVRITAAVDGDDDV
ncbi:hypothetical protein [Leifsonia soli]|uniref:Uncharacterized protein n=1 Tax=Leifsonia soli TaxID=582665 RepID=A0A852T5C5_9MICO|nr:hypothetical protein [Leifsonia soli]NYD76071.1 hypothetical protein [Leifsonia soli]